MTPPAVNLSIQKSDEELVYNRYLNDLTVHRARWYLAASLIVVPLVALAIHLSALGITGEELMLLGGLSLGNCSGFLLTYTAFVQRHANLIFLSGVVAGMMLFAALVFITGLNFRSVEMMYNHTLTLTFFLMFIILFMPIKFHHAFPLAVAMLIFYLQRSYVAEGVETSQQITGVIWFSAFISLALFENFHANRLRRKNFFSQRSLAHEKARSEDLMDNMIPRKIADRLKESDSTIADNIGEASVLFADLVGFTNLSSKMLPSQIVELIDEIFSRFDDIIDRNDLEKIKTVGDSYMAVAGAPDPLKDHAKAAARAAIEMRSTLYAFNQEMKENLDVRIGIHSGSLVGGVIGKKKMTYDVWGDTVNTASRMESHSENGQIQISEPTFHLLKREFVCEPRGEIEVKGKGAMHTYFLLGTETSTGS